MSEKVKKQSIISAVLFAAFIIYTFSIAHVDVAAIGPEDSEVGFSSLNGAIAGVLTFNKAWYTLSKLLGIVAFLLVGFFVCLMVMQMISKRGVMKADKDLYILFIFYVAVFLVYILFEALKINYRPVILKEGLEASYPSTHTLIGVCVYGTAAMQFKTRIRDEKLNKLITILCICLMALLVIFRLLSGVHWFTDIIGGLLLSAFLVSLYSLGIEVIKK